jgi:hypothetical protein
MKLFFIFLLLSMLVIPTAVLVKPTAVAEIPTAQSRPTPQLNQAGDYSRTGHLRWIVVDSDTQGVNCRWSESMPSNWFSPSAHLPPMNVRQWGVVRQFSPNTVLTADQTPAGFVLIYDDRNLPWLKISIGDNDRICLVRANQRYIRPIH